jgi:hypothetical protein
MYYSLNCQLCTFKADLIVYSRNMIDEFRISLVKILLALNTLIDDFDDRFLWLLGVKKTNIGYFDI